MSDEPAPTSRAWVQPPRGPGLGPRRWNINVLLVEDDAADTSLILNVLKRHPNVASAHAVDAPDVALRQLAAGQGVPDLILLDLHMPRINGFVFLERLREIPRMAETPVVFLTTSALAKDVLEAKQTTASLYMVKPDTYFELQTRLDGVVKRAISGAWSR
jgi:CheY-like chemotaxis protein